MFLSLIQSLVLDSEIRASMDAITDFQVNLEFDASLI